MSLISETGMVWTDSFAVNYQPMDPNDTLEFLPDGSIKVIRRNPAKKSNTSFNTVAPPCEGCPVMKTCTEECRPFKTYAQKGIQVDHPFV